MYTEEELVRIARRENNTKRNYLVVNRLQGKHVPVSPAKAMGMFHELGNLVKEKYLNERLLLIGFAETATAIGAAIAASIGCFYMQTTRELIDDAEYLFFSEAHSHATEQKLVRGDIESVITKIDRIIFIEDEVTTGNTILNIVRLIGKEYPTDVKFAVASLLNGMDEEAKERYRQHGIALHFLVKTNHNAYGKKAECAAGDGTYIRPDKTQCIRNGQNHRMSFPGFLDARRLVEGTKYQKACDELWEQIAKQIDFLEYQKILVLGTEEFMYPALYTGKKIEELGKEVLFHATTRSPIEASKEADYPLHTRYELASFYEEERTTYLYNIGKYDAVLILTDAKSEYPSSRNSIINALQQNGNTEIYEIRVSNREREDIECEVHIPTQM